MMPHTVPQGSERAQYLRWAIMTLVDYGAKVNEYIDDPAADEVRGRGQVQRAGAGTGAGIGIRIGVGVGTGAGTGVRVGVGTGFGAGLSWVHEPSHPQRMSPREA